MDKEASSETSFEIIDKKNMEQENNSDKNVIIAEFPYNSKTLDDCLPQELPGVQRKFFGTLSSISSPYSISSPSSSCTNVITGNILTNVPPPTTLPDFTSWKPSVINAENQSMPSTVTAFSCDNTKPIILLDNNQFPNPQFSAAIPAAKGVVQGNSTANPSSLPLEGEITSSNGFFGFVKDALSSQAVSKIVEKAKHSVDVIITTLDPQMNQVIYSGGLEIAILSDEEDILNGVKEAACLVFGKAIVNGIKLELPPLKNEAVGFDNCNKIAENKINEALKLDSNSPVVAVENMLLKQNESWYDISILILSDPVNKIKVQTFSQATPVPVEKFLSKETAEIDVENKLSEYLMRIPGWQEEVSGILRKDVINSAAKVLLKCYKDRLLKGKDVNFKTTIHK